MKVIGNTYPDSIWIRYTVDGMTTIRLRKDIEILENSESMNPNSTMYTYNEVEISLVERENLLKYVEDNFIDLFDYGMKQEKVLPELSSEEKIQQLLKENNLLKAQNEALSGRTDFHEEVLTEIILSISS